MAKILGVKEKRCRHCSQIKQSEHFCRTDKTKDGLTSYCKECCNAKGRLSYHKDLSKNRLLKRKRSRIIRAATREFIDNIKSGPCTDCGQTFPSVCMEFDHLPQYEKISEISKMMGYPPNSPKLLEELSKCELVCRNCHRIRSAGKDGYNPYNILKLKEKLLNK